MRESNQFLSTMLAAFALLFVAGDALAQGAAFPPPVPVPEPALTTLAVAGMGLLVVRRMFKRRDR